MFHRYLVTGASGFLGRTVLATLKEKDAEVRALVMENDPLAKDLPHWVSVVYGDVCDDASLERFFSGADGKTCVIHCAGIVSVASRPGDRIYRVNVGGTNNILRHCEKSGVGKLVYVSSVHAIPEKPKGTEITEDAVFSPDMVRGDYAKSKAIATALVFESASRGLNASVVFPSGIIGPGDLGKGSITNMLLSFLAGKLPLAVKGGYDLSGQYATIRDILNAANDTLGWKRAVSFLPICFAKLIAPLYEKRSLRKKQTLYFTPYAVAVLDSNGRFSRRAAAAAFGYTPRSLQSSIRDTVLWLKKTTRVH